MLFIRNEKKIHVKTKQSNKAKNKIGKILIKYKTKNKKQCGLTETAKITNTTKYWMFQIYKKGNNETRLNNV